MHTNFQTPPANHQQEWSQFPSELENSHSPQPLPQFLAGVLRFSPGSPFHHPP